VYYDSVYCLSTYRWKHTIKKIFIEFNKTLYGEGMLSAAFHVRITGRPERFMAPKNFIKYVKMQGDVWIATREEIASYWIIEVEPNL